MLANIQNHSTAISTKTLGNWFETLELSVAPSCNMMCNFCSKESDCVCNGNNPASLSKVMTPRQAVNWAVSSVNRNKRIKVIGISGPGEPLCSNQTFEVLKRLNNEVPDCVYSISTNGLLLDEKAEELERLNVGIVNVSINAMFPETALKLYSRIIQDKSIIVKNEEMLKALLDSQINGIRKCLGMGIAVNVNTIYFPGINERDIFAIAVKCKELGVKSICIISHYPNGKLKNLQSPDMMRLVSIRECVSKVIRDVEIKSFMPS